MDLTKITKTKYPIIQGGMANIATGEFAAHVSNAGALGTIAAGGLNAEKLREQIHIYKRLSDKSFAVNIMLKSHHIDDIAQVVVEEEVPIVITGAGSPSKYMKTWKEQDMVVIPVVASPTFARKMEKDGADAVIAEGQEAGGHIGEMTTMTLVPQVKAQVDIPVIAAGGIASGEQMLAAEILGATGVQVGTMLLVSEECPIHKNYKEKLLKARDAQVTVIGRIGGLANRMLKNSMTRQYIKDEKAGASMEELEMYTLGAGRRAVHEGDVTNGSLMAGLVVGQLEKIEPVADIIKNLYGSYLAKKEEMCGGK